MDPDGGNLIPQAGHRQWDRLSFWLVVGQVTGDSKYLGRMNGAIRLATLWWFCDKFVVTGWRNITVCSDSFSHADSIGVSILTFRAHRFICSQQYTIHCLELKKACEIFRPLRSLVADDFLKHYGYSLHMAISYIILLNFIIQGGIFRKRVIFLGYRGVSPKHTEQHSLAKSMFTLSQSQSDTSSCEVWRTRTIIQAVESWKTAQYAFAKSRVEPNETKFN